MQDTLAQPERKSVFVVERESGGLGGFLEVSIREPVGDAGSILVGHIEGWYVDPDLRGLGTGRRLMLAAEAWAGAQGMMELTSSTEIGNRVSRRAHGAYGFRETVRLAHFLKAIPKRKRKSVSIRP